MTKKMNMTRYFLCLLLLFTFSSIVISQEAHHDEYIDKVQRNRFRYGLNGALAFPSSKEIGGFEADFDIRYRVLDNLNVGARMSYSDIVKDRGTRGDGDIQYFTSSVIIAGIVHSDYYFNVYPSSFAPFVGLGFGVYDVSTISIRTFGDVVKDRGYAVEYKFGGVIRGGFEYKRLRVALEYNLIPLTQLYDQDKNTPPYYIIDNTPKPNSYLSLRVGFFIGGRAWGDDHRE